MQALLLKVASTRMSREGYKSLDHATRPFRRHQRGGEAAMKSITDMNHAMKGSGIHIASGKYSMMGSQLRGDPNKKRKSLALGKAVERGANKVNDSEKSVIKTVLGATSLRGNRLKETEPNKYLVGQGKKALSQASAKAKRSIVGTMKRQDSR
jgi:hypothetical protein